MDLVYDDYEYEEEGDVQYADYYDDDTFDPNDVWEDVETNPEGDARPMSLNELYRYCIIPTVSDSYKHLLMLLSFAFIFHISCRSIRLPHSVIHLTSLLSGGALVYQMFQWRCHYMAALVVFSGVPLWIFHRFVQGYRGPATFIAGVSFLVFCENFLVDPLWWHAIRGVQMILLMKIVSVGYDLDAGRIDRIPGILEIAGYLCNPGSILFGPWISLTLYRSVLEPFQWNAKWILNTLKKSLYSGIFLIVSTCIVNWGIPDNSSQWVLAFRDALSFRCSHYFVSYLSEVSSNLAGIDVGSVSEPWAIEAPRSLVQVVIFWNKPMHHWLKLYVFKPVRGSVGVFGAILCTYGISAMFHGLNFQLAAVLISLGFYTYTEHELRTKLAVTLNACVKARPCKQDCQHQHKGSSTLAVCVNVFFCIISVFHLAYLGMMFDSSARGMEEQGYSMAHAMKKWGVLNYASHWLSLAMFIVMSIL